MTEAKAGTEAEPLADEALEDVQGAFMGEISGVAAGYVKASGPGKTSDAKNSKTGLRGVIAEPDGFTDG